MQLTGKIIFASKVEQVNETFKKRNMVIEIDSDTQWPQEINIELHQDKVDLIKGMKVGDIVTVDVNLRGKSYIKNGNKSWFNTLVAWRVNPISKEENGPFKGNTPPLADQVTEVGEGEDDGLPF